VSDENKAAVRRLYQEALNQGDLTVIDQSYAPDVELHFPGVPEDPYGPVAVHQLFRMMRDGFPGLQAVIEDLVAEGDKVVARVSFHRPHEGQLDGISPQARPWSWTRIDIFRLFRGRIVEQWADRDDVGMLQQFGVVPPRVDTSRQVSNRGTAR
jgi:predicted ester cyclase